MTARAMAVRPLDAPITELAIAIKTLRDSVMMWTTRPRFEYSKGITGVRKGSGSLVVLIHGVGLNADSWGAQIDFLSASWTVHALDLPGHGGSVRLDGEHTLADFGDALAIAIRTLNTPALVAGHSLGALIALDLVIRYPELVRGAAVLNAVHRRSNAAREAVLARAASMHADTPNDPSGPLQRWFGEDRQTPAARACRDWLMAVDPAGYKAAYTTFANSDSPFDGALSGIACPMLYLTGDQDANSTPAMSHELAALTPGGRAVIIEGAAHMTMMTHPETVNDVLINFFSEVA